MDTLTPEQAFYLAETIGVVVIVGSIIYSASTSWQYFLCL